MRKVSPNEKESLALLNFRRSIATTLHTIPRNIPLESRYDSQGNGLSIFLRNVFGGIAEGKVNLFVVNARSDYI